jgi:hypothetical protein
MSNHQQETVGRTADSTRYHFLNGDQMRSLCGRINGNQASSFEESLTQQEAKQRGLSPCGRCLQIRTE